MTDKPISERHSIANRIALFIIENRLASPYGGAVTLSKVTKRPCYTVAFSVPRVLDGTVSVYAPNFINVRWITGYRDLPHEDTVVFTSEADAINFLRLAFVEGKYDEALAIPTLPRKPA